MKRNDLVGECYGLLLVTGISHTCARSNVVWACVCACGAKTTAYAYDLRSGKVVSCGCYGRSGLAVKHGMARSGVGRSKTYTVWAAMLQRCVNPKDKNYKNYGGRGITVCKRWLKFENFLADMGEPLAGLSIDRKNNERGYTPSNCYWATREEQSFNKRNTVRVVFKKRRTLLNDVLLLIGYSRAAVHYQMNKFNLTHQEVIDKWLQKNTP